MSQPRDDGRFEARPITAADCARILADRRDGKALRPIATALSVRVDRVRPHVRGGCDHRDGPAHYLRDPIPRQVFEVLVARAKREDGHWIGETRELLDDAPVDGSTTSRIIKELGERSDGIDRQRWSGQQGPWEWDVDPTLTVDEVIGDE